MQSFLPAIPRLLRCFFPFFLFPDPGKISAALILPIPALYYGITVNMQPFMENISQTI